MTKPCRSENHECAYALCNSHAPWSHGEISDNYCERHLIERLSLKGFTKEEALKILLADGWYKETCEGDKK